MASAGTATSTTHDPAITPVARQLGYDGRLTCSIQVSDIQRAISWYESVLGMKLLYHLEDMGWCELATPIHQVSIGLSQVQKPNIGLCAKLVLAVKDISAARRQLELNKVQFDGETIEIPGMVRLASFFDPDGNPMMFSQSLGKTG